MPNFVYPFLYLGNILGIDVTCAVKSDKYLVDVCSDAFHQTVTLGNFGTVGREINPRPNTITDILGLVLVTVLLTLGKNVLHFRFGETNIEGVGLLLLLAFQVLAFIVGKLALVLVGKSLVKVGSDLFVKCVIDCSLVGHTLKLHSLVFGRSSTLLFLGFHSGVSFVCISALADFLDRCAVVSGLGVSLTSIWYFRSLCGAKYNACYFCCAVALFSSLWDFHITQAFDAPSANLELCDLNSPPLRSAVILAHAPA